MIMQNDRLSYAKKSFILGISLNCILFIFKLIIGLLSNSLSIISDAFNNLADVLNFIIISLTYRLSLKPADHDHPYGHGRAEYIANMLIALVFIIFSYELIRQAIIKFIDNSKADLNIYIIVVICISILFKIILFAYHKFLYQKLKISSYKHLSQDSINDIILNLIILLSFYLDPYFSFSLDAILSLILALFIFKLSYDIIKETSSFLLGKRISGKSIKLIKKILSENNKILSYHDLMLHSYGPLCIFGSCHIDLDSRLSFSEVHRIIDKIEKRIYKETKIIISLHPDPVDLDSTIRTKYLNKILEYLKLNYPDFNLHDFHLGIKEGFYKISFDLVLPYNFALDKEDFESNLIKKLNSQMEIKLQIRYETAFN